MENARVARIDGKIPQNRDLGGQGVLPQEAGDEGKDKAAEHKRMAPCAVIGIFPLPPLA